MPQTLTHHRDTLRQAAAGFPPERVAAATGLARRLDRGPLADGALVEIASRTGRVQVPLEVTDDQRIDALSGNAAFSGVPVTVAAA